MAKNPYGEPFDDDNDFGFTFADEDEISSPAIGTLEEEVANLKSRLQELKKIFRPLLENLSKNPEKPMIKWPNREQVILKQLEKLDKLTKV